MLDRRRLIASGAGFALASIAAPGIALGRAATDKRLLFVIQRGAADGMALLAPVGDPHFMALRHLFAPDYEARPRLSSFFALHPKLEMVGKLAASGDARFLHAAATAYRERSHFDAQNLLEGGGTRAYQRRDGWLNRLVGLLPDGEVRALALSPQVPLAMQGPERVTSYAPTAIPEADGDLLERVSDLYADDPQLLSLWSEALKTREMAGDTGLKNLRNAQQAGALAASLMAGPEGARVMMVESTGWDSHANQRGQLGRTVGNLDTMLGAFHARMGDDWRNTLVIVATEFGRTAQVNGTAGTDHGTASMAMFLGGNLPRAGVDTDWPGLAPAQLHEGRDLRPTASLEQKIASTVAGHFGLDGGRTMAALFPGRS
ncbi:MAG: DUF1501 domain-containing protein [Sphingomonadaceae bacterium]|nr:DUF1501 domain-containing protein [Sphingomonadaceae bacterium]